MAGIEDLKPIATKGRRKGTDPFTKEQLRKMSEKMGDMEWQMGVAPYLGYAGPIDPEAARYHALGGTNDEFNMKGFHIPSQNIGYLGTPEMAPFKVEADVGGKLQRFEMPKEPGTVNVVGATAAKDNIWGHEYRHKQHPLYGEDYNRVADAAFAQNEKDWGSAVKWWRDQMIRMGENVTLSEAERDLIEQLKKNAHSIYHDTGKEAVNTDPQQGLKGAFASAQRGLMESLKKQANLLSVLSGKEVANTTPQQDMRGVFAEEQAARSYWMKRARELEGLDEYNKQLPKQNKKRASASTVLPDSYRKGGRVKLI